MKRVLSIIYIICILFLANSSIFAQTVDVCGDSDTIVLKTSNYQYGTVQWQSSLDNTNWTNIHGANDTIYKYFPSEEKYFRAMVRFAECPPIYSEVSHVQLKPIANAGADRIVPGNSVIMMGSINSASSGSWSVYSGNGGSFTDSSDPYTAFEGTDTIYQVVWEVSNACGTSSDTIEIQFRENIYIDELVVVDETDILTSDAGQLEAGEYVIEFSDPVPEITDSTVLLGLINDGFMRKVESFTNVGDVYTMQTVQASLEDITKYGAFDVGQAFSLDTSLNGSKKSSYKRLDHMPTRAELISNPELKNGNYYYIVDSEPTYVHPGVSINNMSEKDGGSLIDLEFNQTILDLGNIMLELNGSYSFNPNFRADLDYKRLRLKSFKMGMYNGIIERNYELILSATASTNVLNQPYTLISYPKNIVFLIGGVPVWILAEFKVDGNLSIDVGAEMEATHSYNKTSQYVAAVEYEDGEWDYIYDEQEFVETDNTFEITGDLTQHFDIGPNITFKIYGVVGPYIDARITEELNLCFYNDNWQANMDIGGELTVGALAEVLGYTLFDVSKTWDQGFYNLQFPHNIEIVSGNNQTYSEGNELEQEITVKVIGNHGIIVPGTIVHFEPQNGGTVNSTNVFTNSEGIASVTWTPGGLEESQLYVSVLDCDGNNINNSPVIISAYTVSNDCSQTSLSVIVSEEDGILQPIPSMGTPPYTYSTDGISFNSTVPQISIVNGETYLFMVRDAPGCYASESFVAPTDVCENTNLIINTNVMGNVIEVGVSGGEAPYQFSIDDQVSYSSNNTFTEVVTGTHIIYVKDANECEASIEVDVYDEVVPVIAEFTADNTLTYINQPVQFYDFSNNATSWLWDFGDGNTSTERNPIHVYSLSGTYDISLTVENEFGTDTEIKQNYVWVSENTGTESTNIYMTNISNPLMIWYGDFTNDGYADMLTRHYYDASISLFINNGDGTFGDVIDIATRPGVRTCAVADYNNDSNLDFAFTNAYSSGASPDNEMTVYLGNGDGTFQSYDNYTCYGSFTYDIFAGDINNDSFSDLVISSAGWDGFSVMINNGDGTFTTGNHYSSANEAGNIKLLDVDGDSNLDVSLSCGAYGSGYELEIFTGNGDGTFNTAMVYTSPISAAKPFVAGYENINSSTGVDIIASYRNTSNVMGIYIYVNNGYGVFTEVLIQADFFARELTDYNGDGKIDIIANQYSDSQSMWEGLYVLYGNGLGNFSTPVYISDKYDSYFHDLNNDDFMDYSFIDITGIGVVLRE